MSYERGVYHTPQLVLRASSGIPASYLTCGSSIIQVMLASFKYLLEHKVLEIFSFIYNSSSNNCLSYVFIQEIIIAKSKKLKKNCQFQGNFTMKLEKNCLKLLKVSNLIDYILTTVPDQNMTEK